MLPGVTVVPGNPGAELGNDPVPGGTVGEGLASLSIVETAASAGESAPPDGDWVTPCTTTVRVICSPGVAALRIWSVTSNSSAWYAGSEPIEQVVR
jgi:hypothetical protein